MSDNDEEQHTAPLEFQDFSGDTSSHTHHEINVPIDDQPLPGDDDDDVEGHKSPLLNTSETTNTQQNNNNNNNQSNVSVWSLHYILTRFGAHRYFDVDTEHVVDRTVRALLPFRLSFLEAVKDSPDLYGPFWITTTLIVVLSAAANLSTYFHFLSSLPTTTTTTTSTSTSVSSSSHGSGSLNLEWTMNFHYVTVAAAVMYGYMALSPVLLWGAVRWRGVAVSLLQMVALFGYSLAALVPATALCVVPLWYVRLIVLLLGLADAAAFLILNLIPVFRKSPGLLAPGVGYVLMTHAGMGVLFMLYFFYP